MSQSVTPRTDAVAPVKPFVTDSDHWAVDKTDYDALLEVSLALERELAAEREAHAETKRIALERAAQIADDRASDWRQRIRAKEYDADHEYAGMSQSLTVAQIDAISALEAAVGAPEPWREGEGVCGPYIEYQAHPDERGGPCPTSDYDGSEALWLGGSVLPETRQFIIALRNAWPQLKDMALALHIRHAELQQERAARERAEKRIAAALEELDGYEDVEDRPNGEGVRPNLAMRVGMRLRGEGPV